MVRGPTRRPGWALSTTLATTLSSLLRSRVATLSTSTMAAALAIDWARSGSVSTAPTMISRVSACGAALSLARTASMLSCSPSRVLMRSAELREVDTAA